MTRFTAGVEHVLRRAGWVPHRRVDISRWKASVPEFDWHAAAEDFLTEFGGLRVDIDGPGTTCVREPFEFDPDLAVGEEERFADLSDRYGHRFFPLGEVGQGEFFLAIDEQSVVYLVATAVLRHGSVDLALEQLITGVAPERLSPPPTGATFN
ncbi:SUKH-3 domain-containing protein [Jidongwangia harbinensis]|uniref:SUKH-3 domain-containing protein n=1 Tax=Jidongwangia harbinensis TaxID=2878561 RepID=UPI001CD96C14|nr:SUKH-3 domain-containing protein [Jidongwangia harbinensis]MCA2213288.1 SUKH-3 domain-containing protein [Jidongwangia harbinensis]